jgi:hypothetical protein
LEADEDGGASEVTTAGAGGGDALSTLLPEFADAFERDGLFFVTSATSGF